MKLKYCTLFVLIFFVLIFTIRCDSTFDLDPVEPEDEGIETFTTVNWDSGTSICFGDIPLIVSITVETVTNGTPASVFFEQVYVGNTNEDRYDIEIPSTGDYLVSVDGSANSFDDCNLCCDTECNSLDGKPNYFGDALNNTFVSSRFSSCNCC